jgi:hypothetical protein
MNKRRVISAQLAVLTCVLCALSSPAFAQCSASANANAGDNITVLAILHTTDPNENGEGEPLSVTISNGGPTTSFSDYEVTHSFIFTAVNTGPVTAVGTNVGFDGDESCEISVGVNAKHRFSQTTKNVLGGITGGFGVVSGSAWVVAESCALGLIGPGTQLGALLCSGGAGLTAASAATISALAGGLLLIDPIDLNYTVIPVPVPAPFTPVTAGGVLTQADANARNAQLSIEAQIIGVLRATQTAVNRAAGAASVGNAFWEQQQHDAINGFVLQLGGLLTQDANARQTLVGVLTAENAPTFTITAQQVLTFEQRLAFQGWTANELAIFNQIGDDDTFANALKPLIFTQDINQVAGTLPAALANPTLINTLQQGGETLTPFAGVPGNANCHGVTVSALATQFGSISQAAQALGLGSVQNLQSTITAFCGN